MILLPLMLAGCSPTSSDAELYSRALVDATDYGAAAVACQQIVESALSGDCQVAVMERWEHFVPSDCAAISSALWRDECFFLLAEWQWKSGLQAEGLTTCRQTRFARACTWHLIQDEAEAALKEAPEVAEARLVLFEGNGVAPDAALHFWKLWLRGRLGQGTPIDEETCSDLANVRACREAVGRIIHELLDASSRLDREAVCIADPGNRVRIKEGSAWVSGELSRAAEQQWVVRYCSAER